MRDMAWGEAKTYNTRMVNVGMLIPTPSGLRTVVQVLPGHVDPTTTQAVTLPVGDGGSSFPPLDYFGTPLPGQAASAASFVQTLILPSDVGTSDGSSSDSTGDSGGQTATLAAASTPAGSDTASVDTTLSGEDDGSGSGTAATTGSSPSADHQSASQTPSARPDAYTHAAGSYQAAQQRGEDGGGRPTTHLIG